jgi:hypothetical protein
MRLRSWWVRSSLFAASFAVPFGVSALAHAEGPCGDQTCPKNWECRQATATDGVACAPGQECAEPTATTFDYCEPLPCSSDADCAADMVCYSETRQICSDPPPCEKDADCAAPADSACTPETRSACVPRYLPPCETASDCGVGFTCEEPTCGCTSGSAGSGGGSAPSAGSSDGSAGSDPVPPDPPGDAGAAEPAEGSAGRPAPGAEDGGAPTPPDEVAPSDCTCPPATEKTCRLTLTACSTASDCPAGFTCETNPETSCSASSDGTTHCDTPNPARICAPPYTALVGSAGGGRGEDASGTPTHAGDPPKSDGTANSGSNGATADPDAETVTHESSSDGCSVARAPRPDTGAFGLAALAACGALGALGLRRKRAR